MYTAAKQNSLRPLNHHECQKTITSYLEKYQELWEEKFGLMEENYGKGDGNLVIRSTGYGVKTLLGQMMSDRMVRTMLTLVWHSFKEPILG